MPRKKKPQSIESRIATKSFGKLSEEIEKTLAADKQDRPIEELLNSDLAVNSVWGSGSPPHTIRGVVIE